MPFKFTWLPLCSLWQTEIMNEKETAVKFLQKEWENLLEAEKKAIEKLVARSPISRDTNKSFNDDRTFGEKIADSVAKFGGS